jgi:hypothetical protein
MENDETYGIQYHMQKKKKKKKKQFAVIPTINEYLKCCFQNRIKVIM